MNDQEYLKPRRNLKWLALEFASQIWGVTMIILITLAMALSSSNAHAADWQYPQVATADNAATGAPTAVTVNQPSPYFTISREDIDKAVAVQIKLQGIESKTVQAMTDLNIPMQIYTADHPLKLTLQSLQIDKTAHRWQGEAYVTGNGATETVRPVAGRYETLVAVPVLSRQLDAKDVIEASDLSTKDVPERQLRKDTVTSADAIIGKSPMRMISSDRPIRLSEVTMPIVIKKGQAVEMTYNTAYVHIHDQGEALEDGSTGTIIRVKNAKTGRAVNARVVSAGRVETNTELTM